jgi:hypothetical protein
VDGYVVVPHWERFQHYGDREPNWIKVYTELNHRDDWRELTYAARGLLVSLWVEYASARGVIRARDVHARCGQRVTQRTWDLLLEAGWIEVSASKPLALTRARALAREKREERDTPLPPSENRGGNRKISGKELARYTGCRLVRGSHGASHVYDVLGTDKPPNDWPHEPPSRREVETALEGDPNRFTPDLLPSV